MKAVADPTHGGSTQPKPTCIYPGRDTLTARKRILEEAIHWNSIREWDLKQIFDKVNIKAISERLRIQSIPELEIDLFEENKNF